MGEISLSLVLNFFIYLSIPFALAIIAKKAKLIVSVEEHFLIGGLGSAIAEVMAESGTGARLLRMGVDDQFVKYTGSQKYLRGVLGLDVSGIVKKIKENL